MENIDSSGSDVSFDSFASSSQHILNVKVQNGVVFVYYFDGGKRITSLNQLRHNRMSNGILTDGDKRAASNAVSVFTESVVRCGIQLIGENSCAERIFEHTRSFSAALLNAGDGGLFRFECIVKAEHNGRRATVVGNVPYFHIVQYPFRGRNGRINLGAYGVSWLGGVSRRMYPRASLEGQTIMVYLQYYGWVGGELNTTVYFDKSLRLVYTGPTLQCRNCARRRIISERIVCRMCMPPDQNLSFGVVLGRHLGKFFLLSGSSGQCQFIPHGPRDASTKIRRAARVKPGITEWNLRQALHHSGLSNSSGSEIAARAVFPVASYKTNSSSNREYLTWITVDDWGRVLSSRVIEHANKSYIHTRVLIYVNVAFRSYLWNLKHGVKYL